MNAAGDAGGAGTRRPPGAPTLAKSSRGSRCIVFRWDPQSGDDRERIFGYEMQISTDGASGWTSHPDLLPAANGWFMESGLRPGTDRYYRLRAIGADGPGPWSAVLKDTTLFMDAPVMTASANGTGRIDLSWKETVSSAGLSAHANPCTAGYELQVSDTGSTGWRGLGGTLDRGARSYSHSGIPGGTRKYYRIRALTAGAAGGWSKVVGAQASPVAGPAGVENAGAAARSA